LGRHESNLRHSTINTAMLAAMAQMSMKDKFKL
jgi:hypothetical protein